jgi:hypothetical protein
VPGTRPATVEVAAILERDSAAAETYAIFATGTGCGAITMVGNVHTDSYNSAAITLSGGVPVTTSNGGSVGTNGNLSISGQVVVNGNLDTPRTGVGACTNGNITALTASGTATVGGDRIQLPQAKTYPTPNPPSPTPPTTSMSISSSATCASFGLTLPASCTYSAATNTFTLTMNGYTPSWGNLAMSGGVTVNITGGLNPNVTLNVNSWSLSGNSRITLGPNTNVTLNAAGNGVTSTQSVIDFTGGAITNGTGTAAYDPSKFQILYGGTGEIKVGGATDTAATIYAPNAFVDMNGSAGFYGSVLSGTFKDNGGATVHYDTALQTKFYTLGQHVMSSFSWQKY